MCSDGCWSPAASLCKSSTVKLKLCFSGIWYLMSQCLTDVVFSWKISLGRTINQDDVTISMKVHRFSSCSFVCSCDVGKQCELHFVPSLQAAVLVIGTTRSPLQGCRASGGNRTRGPNQSHQSTEQDRWGGRKKKCVFTFYFGQKTQCLQSG